VLKKVRHPSVVLHLGLTAIEREVLASPKSPDPIQVEAVEDVIHDGSLKPHFATFKSMDVQPGYTEKVLQLYMVSEDIEATRPMQLPAVEDVQSVSPGKKPLICNIKEQKILSLSKFLGTIKDRIQGELAVLKKQNEQLNKCDNYAAAERLALQQQVTEKKLYSYCFHRYFELYQIAKKMLSILKYFHDKRICVGAISPEEVQLFLPVD